MRTPAFPPTPTTKPQWKRGSRERWSGWGEGRARRVAATWESPDATRRKWSQTRPSPSSSFAERQGSGQPATRCICTTSRAEGSPRLRTRTHGRPTRRVAAGSRRRSILAGTPRRGQDGSTAQPRGWAARVRAGGRVRATALRGCVFRRVPSRLSHPFRRISNEDPGPRRFGVSDRRLSAPRTGAPPSPLADGGAHRVRQVHPRCGFGALCCVSPTGRPA